MKESGIRVLPGNQRLLDASSSCSGLGNRHRPPAPCSRFVLVQLSTSDRKLHVGSTRSSSVGDVSQELLIEEAVHC